MKIEDVEHEAGPARRPSGIEAVRWVFSVIVVLALAAGYLGSQIAYFSRDERGVNSASDWAKLVDTPAVAWVALAVLLGSIAMAFVREPKEKS